MRGPSRIASAFAMTVCSLVAAQPAQAVSGGTETIAVIYWFVQNQGTGRCLAVDQLEPVGEVSMGSCGSGESIQWHWVNSSWNDGYRLLKNRISGGCLVSTSPVKMGTCEDWTSRHWKKIDWGDGLYQLVSDQTDGYLYDGETPDGFVYTGVVGGKTARWLIREA
ncbi:hypothetical protein [[Actinomadura] parvosata]|uniref:hypothetical protein n=1 Tax=[Actinomadura] parvosata TaxID=1955412 RepID=UPI001647A506